MWFCLWEVARRSADKHESLHPHCYILERYFRIMASRHKAIVAKAERLAKARLAQVQQLLAEQDNLKNKEVVLEQIIDGLSTMSQLMALSPSLTGDGKDTILDEAVISLLDLELLIHQHTCKANALATSSTTSQDSSSCSQDSTRSSCSPYCLVFLHKVFNPEYAREVMAMSEQEVVARFTHLAGKCAIMVVQHKEQAELWSTSRSMPHGGNSSSSYSGGQQPAAASSKLPSQQLAGSGSGDARNAANSACVGIDAAGAAGGNANAADNWGSDLEAITSSPEFEYTCLAGTLMQWDIERFTRIVANDFETGQPLQPMSPTQWLKAGQKLQLTKAQLATFRGLKELLSTAMSKMFDNLGQATKQQHDMIQQQEVQLQLQQLQFSGNGSGSGSGSGSRVICDTRALHDAQAEAVSVQSSVLKRWHIFWVHMGLVVLNTLTPYQLATLIAVAYPGMLRIDSAVLDHLDALEQHCQQQQQQRRPKLPKLQS